VTDPAQSDTLFEAFIAGTAPEGSAPSAQDLRRNIHRLDRRAPTAERPSRAPYIPVPTAEVN